MKKTESDVKESLTTQGTPSSGLNDSPCPPSFSRFDESWKKEVMKMPKSEIVDLLKKVCGDRDHAKDCYINLHNAVLVTIMGKWYSLAEIERDEMRADERAGN